MTEVQVNMLATVHQHLKEHQAVIALLEAELQAQIVIAAKVLSTALGAGGTVYWCGNGGSASDSQHLAAELVGRFRNNRRPLASVALSSDSSVLTCVANDFGYEQIFSRQVEAIGRAGDVLVAISTSGKSMNVIEAVKAANRVHLATIGLLGGNGGLVKDLVQTSLVVPSVSTARIQECHILIGHILCDLIENNLGIA